MRLLLGYQRTVKVQKCILFLQFLVPSRILSAPVPALLKVQARVHHKSALLAREPILARIYARVHYKIVSAPVPAPLELRGKNKNLNASAVGYLFPLSSSSPARGLAQW